MQKNVRLLALLGVLLWAPYLAAKPVSLRLGSTPWPPFTNVPKKSRIAIELVQKALQRAGVRSATQIVAEGALSPALRKKRFDGSPAMWSSPGRQGFLLFSKAYLENRLVLVGRKGSNVSAKKLGALKGKRIGVVKGYAYGPKLKQAWGVQWVYGTDDASNLRALLKGSVDYILADDLLLHHLFERHGKKAASLLVVGKHPLIRRTLHLALRKDVANAEKIVSKFNDEIRRMMADGSYNRILKVGWIQTDIDGDGRDELVLHGEKAGKRAPHVLYKVFNREKVLRKRVGPLRIVIGGKFYDSWGKVPTRYKVPATRMRDGNRTGLGLVLHEF